MAQNFTESVTGAIEDAFAEAQERKNTEVTDNHLLLAFLKEPEDYFSSILNSLNTHPATLIQKLQQDLSRLPTYSGPPQAPNAARSLQTRIAEAQGIAKKLGRRLY